MNYSGLDLCSSTNGDGWGVDLFVSGCTLNCPGCFNKEAQDFNAGEPFTDDVLKTIVEALHEPYMKRFSILGGDPWEPANRSTVKRIVAAVRASCPDISIWMWTGRCLEDFMNDIPDVDVLIDGPFVKDKKVRGKYFGSSNQRIFWLHGGAIQELV